ncbi:DUF4870 family protein [Cobetia marina]
MSENSKNAPDHDIANQQPSISNKMPQIIYILYLVGLVFGATGLIGVVLAYVYRKDSPKWMKSHYQFQIRTFWIGLLYILIGAILSMIFVGWIVLIFWWVWLALRSVKGMQTFDQGRPHPNPTTWMF